MGSSVWRIFFAINSNGPGLCDSCEFNWSARRAFFSIRCRSAKLGSTWPSSCSRMWRCSSSCRFGRCCIFALRMSPVFARSNCFRCSCNAGDDFNADYKATSNIQSNFIIIHFVFFFCFLTLTIIVSVVCNKMTNELLWFNIHLHGIMPWSTNCAIGRLTMSLIFSANKWHIKASTCLSVIVNCWNNWIKHFSKWMDIYLLYFY